MSERPWIVMLQLWTESVITLVQQSVTQLNRLKTVNSTQSQACCKLRIYF